MNERQQAISDCIEAIEQMRTEIIKHYRIDCEPSWSPIDWSEHLECDPFKDIITTLSELAEANND